MEQETKNIDVTSYSPTAVLQLLKGSTEFGQTIARAENWSDVVDVIDSLGLIYTAEQLEFIKKKQWN